MIETKHNEELQIVEGRKRVHLLKVNGMVPDYLHTLYPT